MRKKGILFLLLFCLAFCCPLRLQAAMARPKILTAKGDYGKITLTWKQVPGATNYYIFREGGGKAYKRIARLAASAGLSYEDTGVKPGVTYTYTMKALRFLPGREKEVSELAKEVQSHAKIPAVTLGSAEASDKGITITWEKIPGVTGYRIYRKEGTSSYKHYTDVDRTVNFFRDNKVTRGIPCRYTVRAFVREGETLRLGDQNNTSVRATLPLPVPKLTAQAASGRIRLNWTAQSGVDGYRIYRKVSGTNMPYKLVSAINYDTLFFRWDSSAIPGKTYDYVIRTYVLKNDVRYDSPDSAPVTVQCLPGNAIPTGLKREGGQDVLTWHRVFGATGYVVYKKNAETGWKWVKADVVKANQTQKRFNRSAGTTYYTVRAKVKAGENILLSPTYFPLDNGERKYTQQNVLFAGDSITWGFCWGGPKKRAVQRFSDRVALLTGISYDCYGFPGDSVAQTNGIRLRRRLLKKNVDYSKYSLIVLEGGTNDYSRSVRLGSIHDRTEDTFYGAWNNWIQEIRAVNPDARILLVLPTFRQRIWYTFFRDARYMKNNAGYTLNQYEGAMRKIARRYDLEVFDAREAGVLTPKNSILLKDGIHPTEEGYILLGDALAEKLKTIMPLDSAKNSGGEKQTPAETEESREETAASAAGD